MPDMTPINYFLLAGVDVLVIDYAGHATMYAMAGDDERALEIIEFLVDKHKRPAYKLNFATQSFERIKSPTE
jgi:hypothetical protein